MKTIQHQRRDSKAFPVFAEIKTVYLTSQSRERLDVDWVQDVINANDM